jgi:hypothetical protein
MKHTRRTSWIIVAHFKDAPTMRCHIDGAALTSDEAIKKAGPVPREGCHGLVAWPVDVYQRLNRQQ